MSVLSDVSLVVDTFSVSLGDSLLSLESWRGSSGLPVAAAWGMNDVAVARRHVHVSSAEECDMFGLEKKIIRLRVWLLKTGIWLW